jgi:hypothetical protein
MSELLVAQIDALLTELGRAKRHVEGSVQIATTAAARASQELAKMFNTVVTKLADDALPSGVCGETPRKPRTRK